ncbi:protein lin-37 homolog isoform X2 [Tachysurus fulvidraco]|uniref:protein lin-37 homolog isoform X2 n=1 Tax=Tachysurus fulvidraco TaxID=1234273 RepID=UPI000F500882|nr:protein lin-37 homolog isoform X2 [Tachysurus fulvidraco]
MLNMKVKLEKPDTEGGVARNRLDAVLQGLVEKSDSERDQNEDESGKMVADSLSKPSSRFVQHRRKKRKEMEDGLTDTNQHKQNSYIIKLFDRSVDLAQFSSNTPLYPICRSWMRNNPAVRERTISSPPHSMAEEEVSDMLNGKVQNIYHLPPPSSCPVNESGDPVNVRIPPSEKPTISQSTDTASGATTLMFNHMKRWKKIRQKWKEASNKNQLRYSESIKILKEMYER